MGVAAFLGPRLRPDRILTLTLAACACIAALILYAQFLTHLEGRREGVANVLTSHARDLDGRLRTIVVQVETLRRRAEIRLQQPDEADARGTTTLLDTFLASNPDDEPGRLFTLDQLPQPYDTSLTGNLMALPSAAARRREGLARPDIEAWRQEARMILTLSPLATTIIQILPGVDRLYYASVSGMLHVTPWMPSGEVALLDTYPRQDPFRRAHPSQNPRREMFWTVRSNGTNPATATAVAPLDMRDGRFLGIFGAEVRLDPAAAASDLPDGAVLLLLDEQDRVLMLGGPGASPVSDSRRSLSVGDVLPLGAAEIPRDTGDDLARVGNLVVLSTPIQAAPWRFVLAVPHTAFLMPTLTETVLSLGGLLLLLLGALLFSQQLMARILLERERATEAERVARGQAEGALKELRAAHDELDFLNREKTRFFSLISHDLRGPFNTLLGMTQELANHASSMSQGDVEEFARSTNQSARQVFELLENLLHWSRVQMSGKPFSPSILALRELVNDAVRELTPMAAAKDIRMLDAVGDRWVLADRTMMLAVLRNLLANAIKFSHPAGVVHITSRALGDRLEIAVTDQGVGMDSADAERILKSDSGQKSRPGTLGEQGTGLGLTLVRDLILRHGGALKLEGVPGKGTVVSFTVPLASGPAEDRRRNALAAAD